MEVIAFFSVDDRDGDPAKKSECHETLLVIGQAIVFIRIGDPLKHLPCVDKVESVFPEIRPTLGSVPGDQLWSVYTNRICVKGCFGLYPATARSIAGAGGIGTRSQKITPPEAFRRVERGGSTRESSRDLLHPSYFPLTLEPHQANAQNWIHLTPVNERSSTTPQGS